MYSDYHTLVATLPHCGTASTILWYSQYQTVVSFLVRECEEMLRL